MERALRLNGVLAGVCEEQDDGTRVPQGADAPVALVVGAPNRALRPHLRGKHQKVWWLAAPNSEGVPPKAVQALMDETYSLGCDGVRPILDGIFATSEWAKGVLTRAFPSLPVVTWQHGVLPEYRVNAAQRQAVRDLYDKGQFQLLHVTSAGSRKGTPELLQAWDLFVKKHPLLRCRLDLLVNPQHLVEFSDHVQALRLSTVMVAPGQRYTTEQLCKGMSGYHGVVQPSRAEGFGLVPLEARASGIPVVMTTCTGHSDHGHGPGVVPVQTGPSEASDDYRGATAPSVSADAVYEGIKTLYDNWQSLDESARDYAPTLQQEWSWENRAKSALAEMEKYNV
jgi:glycosyltransferase involved in cell wall biosynthesis